VFFHGYLTPAEGKKQARERKRKNLKNLKKSIDNWGTLAYNSGAVV
jgi:hypothetical protein